MTNYPNNSINALKLLEELCGEVGLEKWGRADTQSKYTRPSGEEG